MKNTGNKTIKKAGDSINILGVCVNGNSKVRLLTKIRKKFSSSQKVFIVTPNPEFVVFARKNPWFKAILNKADFAVPDGAGLIWASRILARQRRYGGKENKMAIKERISGTDLMEDLCREAVNQDWSVYFLGSKPGVAKRALAVLQKRYPGLQGWAESGPMTPPGWRLSTPQGWARWTRKINQRHPDLLFVAFGMGKQEKFIGDNWENLKVKLAMGVGGAFDYLSGEVPRAPFWLRKMGFEWLYRLVREPRRWRRQLALVSFVWLILKEKLFTFPEECADHPVDFRNQPPAVD